MSIIYLPVDAIPDGMTSAEHADAINRECWNLYRPASIQDPNDATTHLFPTSTRESDGVVAIIGNNDEQVYISPHVDLTILLSILPNVTDEEKTQLTAYIEMNKGGYVPFSTLIPPSSTKLTEAEAIAQGWPDPNAETP
jgi:hypothetical protein